MLGVPYIKFCFYHFFMPFRVMHTTDATIKANKTRASQLYSKSAKHEQNNQRSFASLPLMLLVGAVPQYHRRCPITYYY